MRQKILVGILSVIVGFLVITNPVVAEAAKQITGKQIKNGTITSADIKNNNIKSQDIKDNQIKSQDIEDGSITTADLAPGTGQIKALRRLGFNGTDALANGTNVLAVGAIVEVDSNDVVIVDASLQINTNTGGSIDFTTCLRAAGSSATPTQMDSVNYFDLDTTSGVDDSYAVNGSKVLAAGSYEIGVCVHSLSGSHFLRKVAGTVMVIDGGDIGALSRTTNPKRAESESR